MADSGETEVAAHLDLASRVGDQVAQVVRLGDELCRRYATGGLLYTFGNGGSAADAQHLAAEMVGRYLRERRPLPAVALTVDPSSLTCIANDYGYEHVFRRQVQALVRPADMVVAFSTSGRSPSVLAGVAEARARGAHVAVLTGGGHQVPAADVDELVVVPSEVTARIQEMHLLLLHVLSEQVDRWAAESG